MYSRMAKYGLTVTAAALFLSVGAVHAQNWRGITRGAINGAMGNNNYNGNPYGGNRYGWDGYGYGYGRYDNSWNGYSQRYSQPYRNRSFYYDGQPGWSNRYYYRDFYQSYPANNARYENYRQEYDDYVDHRKDNGNFDGYVDVGEERSATDNQQDEEQTNDPRARLLVIVPPSARLWISGTDTEQMGMFREFVSPPLEKGHDYSYQVRAIWIEDDGKVMDTTQKVPVQQGARYRVDFIKKNGDSRERGQNEIRNDRPQGTEATLTIRVPSADATVWVDGKKLDQTGKVRTKKVPMKDQEAIKVQARWSDDNGQTVERTRTVAVNNRKTVEADFTKNSSEER
ncbi:MAG: TIGR03000 domain-containing protein [Gemmataceae bacterium]